MGAIYSFASIRDKNQKKRGSQGRFEYFQTVESHIMGLISCSTEGCGGGGRRGSKARSIVIWTR